MNIQIARLLIKLQAERPSDSAEQCGFDCAILYLAGELHASGEEDACWFLIDGMGLEHSSYASRLRASE